jgi:hypothetical protein
MKKGLVIALLRQQLRVGERRQENHRLDTPEEVRDPSICDILLSEKVLQLAMLLENVHIVHGLGSTTTAHTSADIRLLDEAYQQAARRNKAYL